MKGTIQNRDTFLKNIAKRLNRDEVRKQVERPKYTFQPQDEVLKGATADELLDVLKKQCKEIHTNLVVTKKADIIDAVKEVIEGYGGGPIVTWKDERFKQYGLEPLFTSILPSEDVDVHEWDYEKGEENIEIVEKANIGVTISDITLAESGTAVLFSSKDRGRTVSFLPTNSIIVMPKSTIVPRMTQAARIIRERIKNGEHLASCINFITGPSNSADIEMILIVGVHGPVRATYVVIDDL